MTLEEAVNTIQAALGKVVFQRISTDDHGNKRVQFGYGENSFHVSVTDSLYVWRIVSGGMVRDDIANSIEEKLKRKDAA